MWELWPCERDRKKALEPGNNMRSTHPFLLAWDRAFKKVFGSEGPRLTTGVRDVWNIFARINRSPPCGHAQRVVDD